MSTHVLGRPADATGPTGRLGHYRAADGSEGAPVAVDLDRPHAALVVGKRGAGKTHTLGVLAEALATTTGVAPVVVDPMGALAGLAAGRGRVREPRVRADAVPAREWPALLGLDPAGAPGGLVWRAAAERSTLDGMCAWTEASDADLAVRRAAANHLRLAASWGVFDPTGLDAAALATGGATVLDCAGVPDAAARAAVAGVARALYDARVERRVERLPWLLVDEAHAFLDSAADGALRTLLTRGRAPGVSLVAATQRPGALPAVARSQADLLVTHRLTAEPDVAALAEATPTYLDGTLRERLPRETGAAVVVDDATESVHGVRVRERETPDEGASPRASDAQPRSTSRGTRRG
jgi:ABC-type transport system involved in cytochrome c biogenesis ATPase subunit